MKPLGRKSYGSIPHLIGSKLGEGDHHVHEGQHRIAVEKTRDKHDLVIVQEKYDGSNVAVAKINGQIIALTRSGYTAESSPYLQHHYFAKWVEKNNGRFDCLLKPNERLCGEWLLQAHGLKYWIENEPFVAFDIFTSENERLCYSEFEGRVSLVFNLPRILWRRNEASQIWAMMSELSRNSTHPITSHEIPEGLIYRVERNGKVDFLAKFVRNDFVPGSYLPETSGQSEVFNFNISDCC